MEQAAWVLHQLQTHVLIFSADLSCIYKAKSYIHTSFQNQAGQEGPAASPKPAPLADGPIPAIPDKTPGTTEPVPSSPVKSVAGTTTAPKAPTQAGFWVMGLEPPFPDLPIASSMAHVCVMTNDDHTHFAAACQERPPKPCQESRLCKASYCSV